MLKYLINIKLPLELIELNRITLLRFNFRFEKFKIKIGVTTSISTSGSLHHDLILNGVLTEWNCCKSSQKKTSCVWINNKNNY